MQFQLPSVESPHDSNKCLCYFPSIFFYADKCDLLRAFDNFIHLPDEEKCRMLSVIPFMFTRYLNKHHQKVYAMKSQ